MSTSLQLLHAVVCCVVSCIQTQLECTLLRANDQNAAWHVGHGPAGSKELCAELQEGLSSFCRVIGQQAAKSCAQSFKTVFRLVVAKKGAASRA